MTCIVFSNINKNMTSERVDGNLVHVLLLLTLLLLSLLPERSPHRFFSCISLTTPLDPELWMRNRQTRWRRHCIFYSSVCVAGVLLKKVRLSFPLLILHAVVVVIQLLSLHSFQIHLLRLHSFQTQLVFLRMPLILRCHFLLLPQLSPHLLVIHYKLPLWRIQALLRLPFPHLVNTRTRCNLIPSPLHHLLRTSS